MDAEAVLESLGESNEAEGCLNLQNVITKKPKVFIRMERTVEENYYGIKDKTTLVLKPVKSHRITPMSKSKMGHFSFQCDELLYKVGQEETFNSVAKEMTDGAMQGTSGVLLFIGPLHSGKSYSLFGDAQDLGIIFKVIERMEHIVRKQCSTIKFSFSMSFIDIDNNVVRDCLAGGKRVHLLNARRKPFKTALGGCIAIVKGLQRAKNRCNTILYIYIKGEHREYNTSFTSRMTFTEIASTIPRAVLTSEMSTRMENDIHQVMRDIMRIGFETACVEQHELAFSPLKAISPIGGIYTESYRYEDISIRKDIYILEDMFVTFARKSKEQYYFEELKTLGLSGKMERPKFNHKPFFNSSELAVALRDVVSGTCDLRILTHLIPRGEFTFENLKVLRFAARASIIPIKIPS